jgi:pimeloyl-ACP methyl ester carboxylesterase
VDVVALRPWWSDFFRLVREHSDVFASLPPDIHLGAVEAYIKGASHTGLGPAAQAMLTSPWSSSEGQAAFYRQIAQADQRYTDEIQERYTEIDLPVHVIWGAEDSWIPLGRGRELQTMIPGAGLDVIEGAGHLIQLDAPAELAVALHRWLDRSRNPD